ncbi:MAG: hypothetical protein A3G34_01840 [Candidatus Lindowbacteria bacterium RIFCSPLOWO2_12_FULL_62_27]|nr:MAG: hypothetical protein A3I06_05785 [Candidatus Lindowbacteria bacterium RIFCSPLOWO2_02_FULL_62_12]OGH59050.1 MAG: hypothetical protein A3G34_01840 [Candidatus Lindowbacteria bacterium RIFCSPLOWO2_12_FULL_62_27]
MQMPDDEKRLYLYEALELRGEYDARIKTLKESLPETKSNRDRGLFGRDEESLRRPSAGFDAVGARAELRALEFKRRKLNSAIQKANFEHQISLDGEAANLNEALESRKSLNERIGELHSQVVASAYERVIYKEGRDIVEKSEVPYPDATRTLDEARVRFRNLNRHLRRSSFEVTVDFKDE